MPPPSRIVKLRYPPKSKSHPRPPKPTRRRRSPTPDDLSDDNGYSAIEEMSDDEDEDEEDVVAAEEEHIITNELSAPRPDCDDDADAEDGDDQDGQDEGDGDEVVEGIHGYDDDVSDGSGWEGIPDDGETAQAFQLTSAVPIKRQVRFADPPSSDGDSSDTDDDHTGTFPDLFVEKSALDPVFRREIEYDVDNFRGNSMWENHYNIGGSEDDLYFALGSFTEDDSPAPSPTAPQLPTDTTAPCQDTAESDELDGYDSDGETTEEDIPTPLVRRQSAIASEEAVGSDGNTLIKSQRGRPRLGSFKLDRTDKPTVVFDTKSGKMVIFTPRKGKCLDSSPAPSNTLLFDNSLLASSAHVMMSAMMYGNGFTDGGHMVGPAEAFFPFSDLPGFEESESSVLEEEDDDEDDAEMALNLEDFITWDDDSEVEQEDDEDENYVTTTPVRPYTASVEPDALGHVSTLNSDIVGAFRRNQINQQLIFSEKATHDSLAFSGPYNTTALRGIKSDHFDTASTPLTPIRRRRKYSDTGRSPSEALAQKRKASSALDSAYGHKRQRSISDVTMLRT